MSLPSPDRPARAAADPRSNAAGSGVADGAEARRLDAWARRVFVVAALYVALALAQGWSGTILDRHESRQVQTLLSAQRFRTEGVSLAYPLPVFGPPWSAPMEFPLYQALVAGLAGATGASLETCGRTVSVAAFAAMLPAVWGLLGLAGVTRGGRWIALATVISAPVFLFYARTVLIESTALALAVWFLWTFLRGARGDGPRWWLAATAFGAAAAAVKITTLVPWLAVAVVGAGLTWRRENAPRWLVAVGVPAAAVVGTAWGWVAFSDAVKSANPLTGFLLSENLRAWNFGTLAQRVSAPFWNLFQSTATHGVLVEGALALALVAATLADGRARRVALGLVGAFLAGPLVFANLYFVHDYYYYAVAAFLTGAVGVLLAGAWARPVLPLAAKLALVAGVLAGQFVLYHRGYGSEVRRGGARPPEIAALVRATTRPDDVVVLGAWDWNPTIPFYAERRAVMLRRGEADLPAFAAMVGPIGRDRLRAVVWGGRTEPSAAVRAWWRENLGVMTEPAATDGLSRLYVRGEDLAGVRAALARGNFPDVRGLLEPAARPWDAELKEQAWTQDGEGPAFPAPYKARSFHGCGVYVTGGERRIIAHAVTELFIRPPAGAKRIVAEFRVIPEAYTREHPGDGVDVEIFEQVADGGRRRLFARHLEPARNDADRGEQRVELADFGELRGDVIFAVTPGPAGRADFDWCDWKSIRVE